jgi:subtilisin-like proprotein convertase family protein
MKTFANFLTMATVGAFLAGSLPTEATLSFTGSVSGGYTGGASGLSQVIPDNTPAGVAYQINFNDPLAWGITSISVTMNISGGYNGDLYAYLSHGNTLVQLLNPNPAMSGSGFNNVTLGETGSSIPTGGSGPLTGSYVAYGNLSAFNNVNPNGAWTIFFADMSPGDTSTLNGFSIDITAVPEPVNVALGVFGGLFAVAGVVKIVRRRKMA